MQPINRSLEFVELKDSGGQLNRTIVGSISLAIAQSYQSVDSGSLGSQIVVGNREESSNHVHIDKNAIVLLGGGNVVLTDLVSLVEVVPIGLSVKLISNSALLFHICSDVKGVISSRFVVKAHSFIVKIDVSSDGDCAVSVNNNHVLIRSQSQADDEGVDLDWIIISSTSSFISVSESDKGINLGLLGRLGPGGDDQEGSYNVSVDGEVKVFKFSVNASLIEGLCVSQVVPILSFKKSVNLRPNIEESDGGFVGSRGDGCVVEKQLIAGTLGRCQCQAESNDQEVVELGHIK